MTNWWLSLNDTHDAVWQRLTRATADRHAPSRFAGLATLGPTGAPELRTVVLRRADRACAEIDIYTDARSAKVAQIFRDPRVSLLTWDPKAHLQVRVSAEATVLTGQDVAEQWAALPEPARADYGADPAPGTLIDAPGATRPTGDVRAFAVIRCWISSFESVYLGRDCHRRARFARAAEWAGQWLQP